MGRTFSNYYNYDEELYRNSKAYGSNRREIEKLSENLKDAIKNDLTPRQMELVNLYYFQHMTMPEIAKMLCINKSTVSRILKSARLKLRTILKYSNSGRYI
jgi:RNA polymerase sigma-70 factor (ECF subfamily)